MTANLSRKQVIFCLIVICTISLALKLSLVNFASVPNQDTFGYILNAISIIHGDFSEPPRKTLGWSFFATPFLFLVNSDHFIDYVNVFRSLSIGVSVITIPLAYALSRKYFETKYSLVATSFFAFEPHLSSIAGQGLSEPLYILFCVIAFYFILHGNRLSYFAFAFAALLWWVRWPGIIVFFAISIIYFINNRKSPKLVQKYLLCTMLFLVIVSPMLIHRYEQYGDPLHFSLSDNFFTGDYGKLLAENTKSTKYSVSDYIAENGIGQFISKFVLTGIYNILEQIFRISFPYLIVLLPFGILFSFRAFDQNAKYIRANWILILVTLASSLISFSLIPERRFLYYLYPFLIIFAVMTIERVIKYGLSTFSFSERKKNITILAVVATILILSIGFAQRFAPDVLAEDEKIQFTKYLITNFDKGKILLSNEDWKYGTFLNVDNPKFFQNFTINYNEQNSMNKVISTQFISLHAKSVSDLMLVGQQYDLKYLVLIDDDYSIWYSYLKDVYDNESSYPYLTKIYDSSEMGLQKFRAKVFEINYRK